MTTERVGALRYDVILNTASMMFDAKGNHKDSYRERHRIYTIIDSVCDKSGKPLFSDADVESLADLIP